MYLNIMPKFIVHLFVLYSTLNLLSCVYGLQQTCHEPGTPIAQIVGREVILPLEDR